MANEIELNKDKKDKKEEEYVRQTGSLKERLGRVKKTRWLRFGIVALIYVLWTIWVGNPLLLLGLLLLADIYLTQFIPWGAWKGWKKGPLRTLMSWVDAIVYALVLVYFLFLFIGGVWSPCAADAATFPIGPEHVAYPELQVLYRASPVGIPPPERPA